MGQEEEATTMTVAALRRTILALAAALIMAAMMVASTAPAFAGVKGGTHEFDHGLGCGFGGASSLKSDGHSVGVANNPHISRPQC